MSWLVYYSLHRPHRRAHARQLPHAGHRSGLRRPAAHHVDHRHRASASICCLVAAPMGWLVARTDMPLRAHGARPGDGLVRDAAVPRRHRLGAAGGAQQRAAQPALSRAHRRRPGRRICSTSTRSTGLIFVISCYTFPYVFVLVANALDRIPGDLEDASVDPRRQRLAHGAPRHHSAGAAGAAGRRAGRLPAGDDLVRLAGDPGAAGGLPHHDHQDLEPVPVSAQAGARRRRRAAAAGAHRACCCAPST